MENLADRFARLETIARSAATFRLGGDPYTGPVRPAGIIRQTSNDSRPIPKRKDGGLSQDYFVLADRVPLKFTLGDAVDGSEPYPTGIVLAPLNDSGEFLDWQPQTKTLGSLQAIFWCSDGSMEAACAEEGKRFTWEILFRNGTEQPRTEPPRTEPPRTPLPRAERPKSQPFDADQYRNSGWKTAVDKQYTHYERLGLNPQGHVSAGEVGTAHRARANWWRQRGAQAQGGKNNPLIAELVPFIKTAEENLQQAFTVLSDVDRKAAYDRELDAVGARASEEKLREFIRFTLRDNVLTPAEKSDLLDQARELGIIRERADELIREEMRKTGAIEADEPSAGNATRPQSQIPIVTGSDHPRLAISQTTLSLGTLQKGQICTRTFTIDNTGGGVLEGSIDVSHPEWMRVSQGQIDPRRHHQEITFQIDTSRLALGTSYVGMVEIRSNGGRQGIRIDFSIELQDEALKRFRKKALWFGFVGGAVFGLLLYTLIPDSPTANTVARVAGNLAVIAFVVIGAMAGKWAGGIGGFFFAGFSEEILRNLSMRAYSAGAWAVLVSAFLYIFARRLLVANLAGDRRTRTWIATGGAGAAAAVILVGLGFALSMPHRPPTQMPDASERTLATSLVGQWKGAVGNSPATLDITQQDTTQDLVGSFTYQGVVEELGVTIKNDGNIFQVILPGRSYRRIRGTGSFSLDTFSGPLSGDGLSISGSYVDTAGHRGRWSVTKVASISGSTNTAPEAAETAVNSSATGKPNQWIELKLGDRKGDFSLDTDRHMYYRNILLTGFVIPAESDGAWVSPPSSNDDVLCFSLSKVAQGILIHLATHTGFVVLDGARFAFGLSAVQWISWSPDGTFGLAAHYYEAHPELFVIATREQTTRRVPISLAKENEEQVFDLESVKWESPEQFRMRATIHCNPYATPDTCTDDTRKKVLRAYDLVINARSLDLTSTIQPGGSSAMPERTISNPTVATPSFDCSKAKMPTEALICRDPELATLERAMVSAYRQLLDKTPSVQKASVIKKHREWLTHYVRTCDAAQSDADRTRCVAGFLQDHTHDLTGTSSSELTYVNRDCDGAGDGQSGETYKDLSQQNPARFMVDLHPGCFSGYILLPQSWEYYRMEATGSGQNWWLAYKWYQSKNSASGQNPPLKAAQLATMRHGSHKIRVQGHGQLLFYPIR